ncbi:MAG TPA: carboxypeptidase-like regulatory domain-containing protein, partial [Catalimonadaceae bacterium]|nr:carboxypeptidase-like regulatory domain-containing protein [Catalimonadaceae bacterium]
YANDKLGRLFLQVRDSEGQPVVHALVEVRTLENQIVQKGRTKAEGMYKGRKLGIGFYEVKVRQVGFAPHKERWQVFDDHDPVRDVVMVRE